jgi:hypothetical protein
MLVLTLGLFEAKKPNEQCEFWGISCRNIEWVLKNFGRFSLNQIGVNFWVAFPVEESNSN